MDDLPVQADIDIAERANVAWGRAINGPHVAVLAAQMARHEGRREGLMDAARTLWEAANNHHNLGRDSKTVLEKHAHELAAALLCSWGNGLEIQANNLPAGTPT